MSDPFKNFNEEEIERYIDSRSGGAPPVIISPSLTHKRFDQDSGAIASILAESAEVAAKRQEIAEKAKETFTTLIDTYNKKFGLDVKLDYDNLTASLKILANPNSPHVLRALQLYTSQIYSAFQSVIYAKFIQSVMILASDILDPENLLSENLSFEAKVITIEKLIGLMGKIQGISRNLVIKGDDIELDKMAQDMVDGKLGENSSEGLNTQEIRDALQLLQDSFKSERGELPL